MYRLFVLSSDIFSVYLYFVVKINFCNPLAELSERILDPADGLVINLVDVL